MLEIGPGNTCRPHVKDWKKRSDQCMQPRHTKYQNYFADWNRVCNASFRIRCSCCILWYMKKPCGWILWLACWMPPMGNIQAANFQRCTPPRNFLSFFLMILLTLFCGKPIVFKNRTVKYPMNNSKRTANRPKTSCALFDVIRKSGVTLADVKECITRGGNIYEKSEVLGFLPIHAASSLSGRTGDTSILKYLISITPVHVNAKDRFGETPLHYAARSNGPGSIDTIKILVAAGANIDAKDTAGHTPLYIATLSTNPAQLMKAMVRLGADVRSLPKTIRNYTPLHRAVLSDDVHVVKILVNAGANLHARDDGGRTPYDIAGSDQIRTYLKNQEKKYWMAAGVALHRTFPKNVARSIMQKARARN